ncbi:MAG: HIT family protein [Bacteroidales bacterium]|nr:HIT family protein [Bacteroidales bacterium]
METIFTKIIKGEIPCYKIAEDEQFFAFLDINPLTKGHTLVVPKKHTSYIFDMGDKELGEMMVFAKKVAAAIQKNVECLRIGVAVIGLEVPHTHIHMVPMKEENDLNFRKERPKVSPEEMKNIAEKIAQSYQNM